jgi:hypothetical protein
VFTPLRVPYSYLARYPQKTHFARALRLQPLSFPTTAASRQPTGCLLMTDCSELNRSVSAPLCSCSGARGSSSKGIKNPEGLAAHRDGATERPTFQFGAALAPRCCPFPVSSTVSRLLMRHSRNAKRTIRHPGATRQTAKPKKFGRQAAFGPSRSRPNFLSKFAPGRRPPRFRGILHLFGRLPRLAASLAASGD